MIEILSIYSAAPKCAAEFQINRQDQTFFIREMANRRVRKAKLHEFGCSANLLRRYPLLVQLRDNAAPKKFPEFPMPMLRHALVRQIADFGQKMRGSEISPERCDRFSQQVEVFGKISVKALSPHKRFIKLSHNEQNQQIGAKQ